MTPHVIKRRQTHFRQVGRSHNPLLTGSSSVGEADYTKPATTNGPRIRVRPRHRDGQKPCLGLVGVFNTQFPVGRASRCDALRFCAGRARHRQSWRSSAFNAPAGVFTGLRLPPSVTVGCLGPVSAALLSIFRFVGVAVLAGCLGVGNQPCGRCFRWTASWCAVGGRLVRLAGPG